VLGELELVKHLGSEKHRGEKLLTFLYCYSTKMGLHGSTYIAQCQRLYRLYLSMSAVWFKAGDIVPVAQAAILH
jgi:hypothetical protein